MVVQICSVSVQHKRNNDGRVGLIKHRESSMGILQRYTANTAEHCAHSHDNMMLTLLYTLFFIV